MDVYAPPTTDAFHTRLMKTMAATIPFANQEEWAAKWDNARDQFAAFNPQNAAEAQLAAFAIAAMEGAMDNFRRAAEPGTTAEKAGRLRGSAMAAGRFYASVYRNLRKSAVAAAKAKPARPASSAPSAPEPPPEHEPRPLHRFQDMPPAQRRATYASPRNPELEAIAVAGEAAMIAKEAAADCKVSR